VTPDFDQELYFEKLGMLPRIDCRQKKEFMAYSQSENIRPGSDGPSTLNDKKICSTFFARFFVPKAAKNPCLLFLSFLFSLLSNSVQ